MPDRLKYTFIALLICLFLTILAYKGKERWPASVLYTNIVFWQNEARKAENAKEITDVDDVREKEVPAEGNNPQTEDEEMEELVAIPPYSSLDRLWNERYPIAVTVVITTSCFSVCLWLLNKTPILRRKKLTWIIAVVLSLALIHLVYYGYSRFYKYQLTSKLNLSPETTILLLEEIVWMGFDREPSRIVYWQEHPGPESILYAASESRNYTLRPLESFERRTLPKKQMQEALQLLMDRDYFAFGKYMGQWSTIDGMHVSISVYDGKEFVSTTGWVSFEGAERLRLLYQDLSDYVKNESLSAR